MRTRMSGGVGRVIREDGPYYPIRSGVILTETESKLAASGSRDAVLHQRRAEIQSIPRFQARQTEVSQQLLFVGWMNGLP